MTEFTPLLSFGGGLLIGLAAVALMAVHGRIAGISGILAGVLTSRFDQEWAWRAAFLAGMVASPWCCWASPDSFRKSLSHHRPCFS